MKKASKASIYDFGHYQDYLRARLATRGESRGLRRKLADATGTRPAFISRVLSGNVHFALEHAPAINDFLAHTTEEAHFFNLLLLKGRSGNKQMEKYFGEQISHIVEKRSVFLDKVNSTDMVTAPDQALYYSKWYYLAIHVLVVLPSYRSRESIARRLGLSPATVSRALEDLIRMGLVQAKGNQFQTGKKRIYLSKDSPWLANLHTHFRQRAMTRIADPSPEDMHFSAAMSISKPLFEEYRKRMLALISELDSRIQESDEEEMYAVSVDLFRY